VKLFPVAGDLIAAAIAASATYALGKSAEAYFLLWGWWRRKRAADKEDEG
jgi:uncharacterized protein (DUF697 family)